MQLQLFEEIETVPKFPTTRYQGSKLKFVNWIWKCVENLNFDTVLDAFGGTGSVAYKMKSAGKTVVYNDILRFNSIIGKALIENNNTKLENEDFSFLTTRHECIEYPHFIEDTFSDIYFTDDENRWLDMLSTNIPLVKDPYKEAIAWFALFQACIIKRPYNLFHRKNLYIRTQEVERSFGNKSTWDTPFETHFKNFIEEANNAIFHNGQTNSSLNKNVFEIKKHFDLVYIDTPYISSKGIGVDYFDFYHFLEGLVDYNNWMNRIDNKSKHKKIKHETSEWASAKKIESSFERLFSQFRDSILVVSYRSDGIPSVEKIKFMLEENGKKVQVFESSKLKYVLSNKTSSEVLIIGT